VGDEAVSQHWSRACNDLIKRVVDLYPTPSSVSVSSPSHPVPDLEGSIADSIAASTISASSAVISVPIRAAGSERPAPLRPLLVPDLRENGRTRRTRHDPRLESCNRTSTPPVPLHQRRYHGVMQLIQGISSRTFPRSLDHSPRGGAVPYTGTLPRTRDMLDSRPWPSTHEERLLRHLRLPPARDRLAL